MNSKKENVYIKLEIKIEIISVMIFYNIFYYFNEIYIKFFFKNIHN